MAGRDGDSLFRDARRDWINERATKRDDFDTANRRSRERDRSPLRRSRERDCRNEWGSQRSRSPDRSSRDRRTRSRERDWPVRRSPDWETRRSGYRNSRERELDRKDVNNRDRDRENGNGSRYDWDQEGRSRFSSDRNKTQDRRSADRDASPKSRQGGSVDNWGRELRLGSDRRRGGDRDWKKSVDDFLGVRSTSPSGGKARDRSVEPTKRGPKVDAEWDEEIRRFERDRNKDRKRSPRRYSKDRSPRDRRSMPRDGHSSSRRSLDRLSPRNSNSRDSSHRSRFRDASPKNSKARDRTPVLDEKSDGEDMVISDDDNNDDSKNSNDEWEDMVLMKYKNDNANDSSHYKLCQPQKTIVVRCMPTHITEVDIHMDITSSDLVCHDIRLVRRKDTGFSRGFAFVEFYNTEDAKNWMEMKHGILKFGKAKCFMEYSVPREQQAPQAAAVSKYLTDWLCTKCQAHNFSKRFLCYVCNASRTFNDVERWDIQASDHPTNTVVLTGLDVLTTEETVLKSIASLSNLPMRSVKIARDPFTNLSKGACYLEMNNVLDAFNLHNSLKGSVPMIDNKRPEVKYARLDAGRGNSQAVSLLPKSSTATGKIGDAAIAAAQWSHQSDGSKPENCTLADVPRLAEYSAALYAKTPQELTAYTTYYTDYYKKQITEGHPVYLPVDSDAELAKAQARLAKSTDSAAPSSSTTTTSLVEAPDGSGSCTYPVPDTSQYQYDPSSGFYYDPYTKLYYDATSQYYYNIKSGKYLYWDATRMTYLPPPTSAQLPEMSQASGNITIVGAPQPAGKGDDKKKEKENDIDRVKVAKRIARGMEKWAKTLNQKKETAKQMVPPTAAAAAIPSNSRHFSAAGAADIGFAVLERKDHLSTLGNYYDSVPTRSEAAAAIFQGSESDEEDESAQEEKSHTDWERLICLLCKRQLGSREALLKHQQMSDLHKQNLSAWYQARGLDPDDAQKRKSQYRDRASERRLKYGMPDTPKPSKLKESYIKARDSVFVQPTAKGIGSENLGNKLLQKMGWQEGMGLGKSNQGRTSIIEANPRSATAGLGTRSAGVTPGPGETYKDCVKKMMAVRYAQIDDQP